jgi:pSer/pThr/pTyr-binding forkhead associated (FHA) protein
MPRLVITKGPGVGRDHAIATECTVGRGTDCDFMIEDPNASRRHFRVSRDGEAYVLEDLGSRNGTHLNGARVQRQPLADGDVVRAGGTEFAFRQKDLLEGGGAPAKPAAVATPRGVPAPAPGAPAPGAPDAPGKKPLPKVVPTRKLRGW